MRPCSTCNRHIRTENPACPFCTTPLRMAIAPLIASVMMIACGPSTAGDANDGGADPGGDTETSGSEDPGGSATGPMTTGMTGEPATTSVDGATDDGDSTGSSESGAGFIYGAPDGGNANCDIFAQDCPGDEKCMPWANDGGNVWNSTICSPVVDDPNSVGESCEVLGSPVSGVDDCDFGAMCWDVDSETLEGECVAMCTGDASEPMCAGAGEFCSISSEGVLALCLGTCDPLDPTCDRGEGCYPVDTEWVCIDTAERPADPYAPCELLAACAGGNVCISADAFTDCSGTGCCTPLCDLSLPDPDVVCAADPGQVCTPWSEDPPEGLENVGVCATP